jgi:hypothetical protein
MHSNLDTLCARGMDDLRPSTGAHQEHRLVVALAVPRCAPSKIACTPRRGTVDSLKNNRNRHGFSRCPGCPAPQI